MRTQHKESQLFPDDKMRSEMLLMIVDYEL